MPFMASYEVGENGEDSAATAQSRNLLYADGVFDLYFNYYFLRYFLRPVQSTLVLCYEITVCR